MFYGCAIAYARDHFKYTDPVENKPRRLFFQTSSILHHQAIRSMYLYSSAAYPIKNYFDCLADTEQTPAALAISTVDPGEGVLYIIPGHPAVGKPRGSSQPLHYSNFQLHNSGKATEVDFPGISLLQACRTFSVHFRETADFPAKSTEQRQPRLLPGLLFLRFFLRCLHVQKKPRSSKSNSDESEVAGSGGVAVSNSEVQYYSKCTVILQYQVVRACLYLYWSTP